MAGWKKLALEGDYSEPGHTHLEADITDLQDPVTLGDTAHSLAAQVLSAVLAANGQIGHVGIGAQDFDGLKTFLGGLKTDTIEEKTGAAGVTIDGSKIKDFFFYPDPTGHPGLLIGYYAAGDAFYFQYDANNSFIYSTALSAWICSVGGGGKLLVFGDRANLTVPLQHYKTTLTIDANDEVTVPVSSWVYLTSAGATDSLDGIGAGVEGQIAYLTPTAGKDITLVHNGTVTAGKKLMIQGEANVLLDQDHDLAIAIYDDTADVWNVMVPGALAAHASSHENGGGDEISVAGLSGALADDQPSDHATPIATHAALTTGVHGAGGDTLATDADIATHAGAADPHTGYQKESEKDAASGYAGLSAGSKLALAQMQEVMGYADLTDDLAVLKSLFDANTFLYATSDDTPEVKTRAEVMALLSGQAAADFSLNTHKLTAVVDPTSAQHAATKAYVDLHILKSLLTTRGDMIYRNATVPARLAKGTAGQRLKQGTNDPEWADDIATIAFVIDGGGAEVADGIAGDLEISFACTILECRLLANQTGSIIVDIWKDTYANFPPTDADSITASAVPAISSGIKDSDTTLSGWTTAIAAEDILRFNVDSCTTIERCTVILKVKKA